MVRLCLVLEVGLGLAGLVGCGSMGCGLLGSGR